MSNGYKCVRARDAVADIEGDVRETALVDEVRGGPGALDHDGIAEQDRIAPGEALEGAVLGTVVDEVDPGFR